MRALLPALTALALASGSASASASPLLPESSFMLRANPPVLSLPAGDQVALKISITWMNNPEPSTSPVSLEASAPAAVEASFSEDPSSSGSSTLTLSVAKNATIGPTEVRVTGYVERGELSEKRASIEIPLTISAPFEISDPGALTLAPCTPRQVQLHVATASDFNAPLTLDAAIVNQPGVMIAAIAGGQVLSPSHATTTVTPSGGAATATLTLSVPPGTAPAAPQRWIITASARGYPNRSTEGTLAIEAGRVERALEAGSTLEPSTVFTPSLGTPGTRITLVGAGFCPASRVAIGDPDNAATPESVSSDGSSLTFRVPRGAATGSVRVLPTAGQGFAGPSLRVKGFRNTFGFSFKNGDYGLRLNEEAIDELFGSQEASASVNGWLVRRPQAYLFETIANKRISGGISFGMAYSSLELHDLPGEISSFPLSGDDDPWHLQSASAPSEPLLQFATERFALQFTDPLIASALSAMLGDHEGEDDLGAIKASLAVAQPVLIGLIHPNGLSIEGHTVLAYETSPLPNGSTAVEVANSNVPYTTEEESDAALHDASELTDSQIIIKSGNWEFPQLGWSGSPADMIVYKAPELPIIDGLRPKLPNVSSADGLAAFGSGGDAVTQLSDAHGSLFAAGSLAAQGSWPKGVAPLADFTGRPAPLQLAAFEPKLAGRLTATVHRAGGGGAMSMTLPGLQATLQSGAHAGVVDRVSVDPRGDLIGYSTDAASGALSGTLLSAPGSSSAAPANAPANAAASAPADHLVQFQASSGGGEQLSFPSGRVFALRRTGAPARVSLSLSAFASGGQPVTLRLPTMRVVGGETLRVEPPSWRALARSRVRVSTTFHGAIRISMVRGKVLAPRFASVRRAALTSLGTGRYRVDLTLAISHAPARGWLSLTASVLRGKHALAQTLPIQLSRAALGAGRAQLALPRTLAVGRYSLRVGLLEASANGPAQSSRTVMRTFAVLAKS